MGLLSPLEVRRPWYPPQLLRIRECPNQVPLGKKPPDSRPLLLQQHKSPSRGHEVVRLGELLHRAGVPQGEQLRGPSMATYVVAGAEDGYRVVFSLAELDSGILESEVIVADTMDGAPLGAKEGPFRLVAPHEKRPARWVRMLKSITVVL